MIFIIDYEQFYRLVVAALVIMNRYLKMIFVGVHYKRQMLNSCIVL